LEFKTEQALQQGNAAYKEGKFEEAKRLYSAVLHAQPLHPDANHNLGVLTVSANKADLALPLFKTALKANPKIEQFWLSYIDALIKDKQFDNAKQVLKQGRDQGMVGKNIDALEEDLRLITQVPKPALPKQNSKVISPSDAEIKNLVDNYQKGLYSAAEKLALSITHDFPKHQFSWKVLGAVLKKTGRVSESLVASQKSVQLAPQDAEAHYNLGNTLRELGRLNQAESSYTQAIVLNPDYAIAYNNLGVTLKELDKLDEAELSYTQAIVLDPDYAEAHNNLGVTLGALGRLDEAVASCKRAIAMKFDYAEAHSNLANTLRELGRLDQAESSYTQAIGLKPGYATAHSNLGVTLQELGRLDEAETSYWRAIGLTPDFSETYYNLSCLHLLQGSLYKGFNFYEWRLRREKQDVAPARAHLIWDGKKSLSGKHFVIYEEQGLGDIIQFCRYLPLLEQKGANITFKVKPNLHALLETMDSNSRLVTSLPEENEIDFETPLMSLPHLLGTKLETIPATNPYLFADQDKIQTWAERVSTNRFKVGICWQGSKTKMDIGRSFPLSLFEGISRIPNLELISLHKGEGEAQIDGIDFDLTTLGHDFDAGQDSFLDTVGVMMNCDLIITSDTAVAHLAGAIGQPTWVVLKQIPDWRWMLERPDSAWYPTMTLYRQKTQGEWVDVFDTIERDLRTMLKPKKDVK
jgi:Flp pilus assembly protein TadD